jgi:hypothetical protein
MRFNKEAYNKLFPREVVKEQPTQNIETFKDTEQQQTQPKVETPKETPAEPKETPAEPIEPTNEGE